MRLGSGMHSSRGLPKELNLGLLKSACVYVATLVYLLHKRYTISNMNPFINKIGAKRRKKSGFGTRVIGFFERNRREAPKKIQIFLQGFLKNSRVFSEKKKFKGFFVQGFPKVE